MKYSPNLSRSIGMIAGGTGITPCLQIIRAACKDPNDNTELNLIYANVDEKDILLKKELDDLAKQHSKFKVHYFLNNPPQGWKGGEGFVSKEAIQQFFPKPADDIKVLMCGELMGWEEAEGELAERKGGGKRRGRFRIVILHQVEGLLHIASFSLILLFTL